MRSRRRKVIRWSVLIFTALFLAWFGTAFLVVAMPDSNKPRQVDAIVVLGPPGDQNRFRNAAALAKAGYAPNIVISLAINPHTGPTERFCQTPQPKLNVYCFHPDPATTQGEARQIAKLAAEHHWQSVMVVTSRYHISRARMIVKRCYPGQVIMVESHGSISPYIWAYQFAEQTGGFLKAFTINRSC